MSNTDEPNKRHIVKLLVLVIIIILGAMLLFILSNDNDSEEWTAYYYVSESSLQPNHISEGLSSLEDCEAYLRSLSDDENFQELIRGQAANFTGGSSIESGAEILVCGRNCPDNSTSEVRSFTCEEEQVVQP